MRRVIGTGGLAVMLVAAPGGPAAPDPVGPGVLPDLQTVVPKHLGIQNAHQREILRFTNGIANRGTGDLRLRPEPPPGGTNQTTDAVQEILDADRNIVEEHLAGTFEYHPEHNHWHVGDVARFEVRIAADDGTTGAMGPVLANERGEAVSVKTSFCLIDWYKLDDNRPVSQLEYFACETGYQGISPGFVDQYHQSIVGQQLDITGAPPRGLLPAEHGQPARAVRGVGPDQQRGLGELRAHAAQPGQPQDPRHRELPLRHPGHVRGAVDQPLRPSPAAQLIEEGRVTPQWEYKFDELSSREVPRLNRFGSEGWEVISIISVTGRDPVQYVVLFKRPTRG